MLPAASLPRSLTPRTRPLAFLALLAALALAVPLPAQILHSSDSLPAFEVATIKPRDPNVMYMVDTSGANQTIRTIGNERWLIAQAFQAHYPAQQVIGLPSWAEKDTYYRIEAKIPDDIFAQMQTLGADARSRQIALMMQSLLADRMKLKVHFETRELPTYDLILAKNGPKLPPPNPPPSPDRLSNAGAGMDVDPKQGIRVRNVTLDGMLSVPWFGLAPRPIVNKTGLTGTYNLNLNYFPDLPARPGAPAQPASDSLVPNTDADRSIFSVLEDDLGLKLVPSKGPVEVIVIDHIEPPSEN
jgi:uncharacterized protein (TIGR03435 family)